MMALRMPSSHLFSSGPAASRVSRASCSFVRPQPTRAVRRCRAQAEPPLAPQSAEDAQAETVMLLEEDDVEVPGGYEEAMNPNTKLGKVVKAACDELEHLNSMELDLLTQAQSVLKKFGYSANLFDVPAPAVSEAAAPVEEAVPAHADE